jgi:molybdopterin converting factor small subunit
MKAKELEEEAKENGIVKYFSRLKEVLNKIDEKLEQDGEIDYLKGLLNDLLIELKDIKV